jgi:hypothetical protein
VQAAKPSPTAAMPIDRVIRDKTIIKVSSCPRTGAARSPTARPTWAGRLAETGCRIRVSHPGAGPGPHNAWMRWMVRIADLIALAQASSPLRLAGGMLALGDGGGVAWSEMSRGLLVCAMRLARRSGAWAVDNCRVIAPTEWNFHPAGGLARALQAPGLAMDAVRAAVRAMDLCVDARLLPAGAGVAHA